ncbi:MAG: hypothetical protein AW07_02644 [Candidatus Accumulibacter sp. SK-11]|nr:MAG: hypothetical protein AW07_02644 [Candidatus Accumulibacter sp. SK-11]
MLGTAAELDLEGDVRPVNQPGAARTQPFVGQLDLPAITNRLRENPELVADAIADGGNLERRQRIEITRRQAAEAAVAQPRLLLLLEQQFQIQPELLHCLPRVVVDSEIDQVVAQLRANQEFGRHVADGPAAAVTVGPRRLHPALQQAVAHRLCERDETVVAGRHLRKARLHIHQLVQQCAFQRIHPETRPPVLAPRQETGIHLRTPPSFGLGLVVHVNTPATSFFSHW